MTLCSGAHLVSFVRKLHSKRYDERDEKRKIWKGREAEQLIARLLYWITKYYEDKYRTATVRRSSVF
jgi:hypothetical protein